MNEIERKKWAYDTQRKLTDQKKKDKDKKKTEETQKLEQKGLIELWVQRSCVICTIHESELKQAIENLKKKYSKDFDVVINICWEHWLPPVGATQDITEVEIKQRWAEVEADLEARCISILHFPAVTISNSDMIDAQTRDGTEFSITQFYDVVEFIIKNKLAPEQSLPYKFAPNNPSFKVITNRLLTHGFNPRWD